MLDHDAAMVAFAKLAAISHSKRQLLQRDKFLLLAAAAACDAGWPVVAEHCRSLVLANNPAHLVKRYATMPDALRAAEFQVFFKQLTRFCSYEKAEHFLTQLQLAPGSPIAGDKLNSGDYALLLLPKLEVPTDES